MSKSVCVTKVTENGALEMDLDALSLLLTQEDLKEHHLAVVSIAGCLRTGKSFLMNFLIRYIQQAGWQNPGWIGDDDTAAENCIEWKSGKNPHTKGIIIWNEIFKIEKPGLESEKLAVLFMDTQGLFDRTMTKEDSTKLFAWTMMLSSSIMLNIKSGIDERELEYLQFYADYAKAMKKSGQEKKSFQDLLFLIRDWQHSDDYPYGIDGGNCYLEESLAPSGRSESNGMWKNLRSSFETLRCFLLPHPGNEVTKKEFTGHNRDISPEFLRCVKELAELILKPVNVKKKTHHGKPLTGYALCNLLGGCDDAFKDGQLPTVESMSVALAKARNETFLHDSMKIYNEAMDKIGDGAKLSDDKLKSMHAKAQEVALERFEEKTDFGGEEIRVVYRERLVEECQYAFKRLRMRNYIHMVSKDFYIPPNLTLEGVARKLLQETYKDFKYRKHHRPKAGKKLLKKAKKAVSTIFSGLTTTITRSKVAICVGVGGAFGLATEIITISVSGVIAVGRVVYDFYKHNKKEKKD